MLSLVRVIDYSWCGVLAGLDVAGHESRDQVVGWLNEGQPGRAGWPVSEYADVIVYLRVLDHVGFLVFPAFRGAVVATAKDGHDGPVQGEHGAADRPGGERF